MQVTVERLGPCQAKIRFTVPSPEWQTTYRRGIQNISANANMKGFRPGKVPPQVIEKQFGAQVRTEAIEHFVRQAYEKAVGENELKIVGFQRVNTDEIKILEGVDWEQSFEVSLRPEIVLQPYAGIEVTSELAPVLEGEVDDAIVNIKSQQSRAEPVGEAGLTDDDMIVGRVEWLYGEGDAAKIVLVRDNLRLSPKTSTPGVEIETFKAALLGVKDGETRDVVMTFPMEIEPAEMRGKTGITRVHVKQAVRLIPPSTEDLIKMFSLEGEPALKDFVRTKLGEAKQEQENKRVEGVILDQLLVAHQIDLPEMMIEEQTRARLEQHKQQFIQQGAPEAKAAELVEKERANARVAAEKGLRGLFLIQTIGEKEKLLVTREDMSAELQSIAARNSAKIEDVQKYYEENRLFDQMAVEILERKVRAHLRQNAKISSPS